MSQQVWLFQRYEQVLEYENTPLLPPPFTPIAHLISLMKHLLRVRSSSEVIFAYLPLISTHIGSNEFKNNYIRVRIRCWIRGRAYSVVQIFSEQLLRIFFREKGNKRHDDESTFGCYSLISEKDIGCLELFYSLFSGGNCYCEYFSYADGIDEDINVVRATTDHPTLQ